MEPVDSSLLVHSVGFIFALIAVALNSFLETSITAVKFFELRELSKKLPNYSKLLNTLEKSPHEILVPILICGSLADVTAASLITRIVENVFAKINLSGGLGFSLGIAIASFLIMLVGEIMPKNFARLQGQRFFASTLWLTSAIVFLLYPITKLISRVSDLIISIFSNTQEHGVEAFTSEQELRFLIQYVSEKNLIEPEKSSMLQNIFSIGNKTIKDILVPENHMITMSSNGTVQDALKIFSTYQFSRIPIYEEDKDNIIGILYQKDLFFHLQHGDSQKLVKNFIRSVLFVPESMKVNQILKEFRSKSLHMAIVLSEYGEIAGLVTLEDVLEEIVGEIRDEHELIVDQLMSLPNGGWLADAKINLDDLGKELNITFEAEDSVTLGGFMTEMLQHLPKKGERLSYNGYVFQVQQATIKQVIQVLIFQEAMPLNDHNLITMS